MDMETDLSQDYSLSRASSLANRASIEARVWLVVPSTSSSLARNAGIWLLSWAICGEYNGQARRVRGNMNARVQSDGRRVPLVSAPIQTGDISVIVESDTSACEVTLRQEDFEAWLDDFRNRYAGMLEYLQSH